MNRNGDRGTGVAERLRFQIEVCLTVVYRRRFEWLPLRLFLPLLLGVLVFVADGLYRIAALHRVLVAITGWGGFLAAVGGTLLKLQFLLGLSLGCDSADHAGS